jgi:hypothetical protein
MDVSAREALARLLVDDSSSDPGAWTRASRRRRSAAHGQAIDFPNAAYSDGHLLREWLVCATTGHQVPSRNQTLIHYQGNYRLASYPDIRIGTI